jgi:curved DNA-binding protein CbpA
MRTSLLVPALMASAGHLSTADAFLPSYNAAAAAAANGVHGRCAVALASSTTAGNNNNEKDTGPTSASTNRNLYEVLGARPSDSQVVLRTRYTALARKLHPDAAGGGDPARFSQVAAAWAVLGDKQARLRYDRSLQASEFAEGFAHALEAGFKTAIPFLQNTASTTVRAVDVTSETVRKTAEATTRTVQDVSGTLERARGRLALEQKKKALEQKASQEATRIKRLNAERDAIVRGDQSARLPELGEDGAKLSPPQAARILKKLGESPATAPKLYREVEIMEDYFQVSAEKIKLEGEVRANLEATIKQKDEAITREAAAIQRLEEAKRELEAARKNLVVTKQQEVKASQDERRATADAETARRNVEQHQEALRKKLRTREEEVLSERAKQLKMECDELMTNQRIHEADAQEIARLIMDAIEEEKERGRGGRRP